MPFRFHAASMALASAIVLVACSQSGSIAAETARVSEAAEAAAKAHQSRDSKAFVEACIAMETAHRDGAEKIMVVATEKDERLRLVGQLSEAMVPMLNALTDEAWMKEAAGAQPTLWNKYMVVQADGRKVLRDLMAAVFAK